MAKEDGDLSWFPFYVQDWLASLSVRALSPAHRALYLDLLCHTWEQAASHGECSLPADDGLLASALHVTPEEWAEARRALVDGPGAVMRVEGGRLVNRRLQREWERAREVSAKRAALSEKRAEAGRAGGAVPRRPPPGSNPEANAKQNGGNERHINNDNDNDISGQGTPARAADAGAPGGGSRPQKATRAPAPQQQPIPLQDPNAKAVVDATWDALKGAGVTAMPKRWYAPACGVASNLLRHGVTQERWGEVVGWALDAKRRRFWIGPLLSRHWESVLAGHAAENGPLGGDGDGTAVAASGGRGDDPYAASERLAEAQRAGGRFGHAARG